MYQHLVLLCHHLSLSPVSLMMITISYVYGDWWAGSQVSMDQDPDQFFYSDCGKLFHNLVTGVVPTALTYANTANKMCQAIILKDMAHWTCIFNFKNLGFYQAQEANAETEVETVPIPVLDLNCDIYYLLKCKKI